MARLTIGGLAKAAGVGIPTVRYYERRALLDQPDRPASGYRTYPPDAVRLIRFIKRAQDLGFTLAEIEELITLRDGTQLQHRIRPQLAAVPDVRRRRRDVCPTALEKLSVREVAERMGHARGTGQGRAGLDAGDPRALRFNGDDQVNPYRLADALREAARALGAAVLTHTKVTGLRVEGAGSRPSRRPRGPCRARWSSMLPGLGRPR